MDGVWFIDNKLILFEAMELQAGYVASAKGALVPIKHKAWYFVTITSPPLYGSSPINGDVVEYI